MPGLIDPDAAPCDGERKGISMSGRAERDQCDEMAKTLHASLPNIPGKTRRVPTSPPQPVAPLAPPAPATTMASTAPAPVANDVAPAIAAPSAAPLPPPAPVAAAPAVAPAPTTPFGIWATEENKGNVRIEPCGQNLCGYAAKTGERILINMKPSDGKWTGQIHDPDAGRKYDSTIAMKGTNLLKVQGCAFVGMFCGGQTWKRIS